MGGADGRVRGRLESGTVRIAPGRRSARCGLDEVGADVTGEVAGEELRSVIDAGELARLRAVLADDPAAAWRSFWWGDERGGGDWTLPISYVSVARFHALAEHDRMGEIARVLLAAGASPEGPDGAAETPVVTAASYDEPEVAAALLAAGADPVGRGFAAPGALPCRTRPSSATRGRGRADRRRRTGHHPGRSSRGRSARPACRRSGQRVGAGRGAARGRGVPAARDDRRAPRRRSPRPRRDRGCDRTALRGSTSWRVSSPGSRFAGIPLTLGDSRPHVRGRIREYLPLPWLRTDTDGH